MAEPSIDDKLKPFLIQVSGQPYLKVPGRILMALDKFPEGIKWEVELLSRTDDEAVVKARVTLPDGGMAEDIGSESSGDFADFTEKAATKAIGRALAKLGFGTAEALADFDLGVRLVDSPHPARAVAGGRPGLAAAQATAREIAYANRQPQPGPGPISDKQINYVYGLAGKLGLAKEDLLDHVYRVYDVPLEQLSKENASALIEALKSEPQEHFLPDPTEGIFSAPEADDAF